MGWNKGHKMSEEHKAAISRARKGMKFSDQHRENIRLSRLGTKTPEETRNKLSALRKAHPEWREKNKSPRGAMMKHGCGEPPSSSMLDFAWLCEAGYEMNKVTVPLPKGGRYLLDFAHREAKVNIEIDGKSHVGREKLDALRDEYLRFLGWKVIRIKV
jgi:hypothetical protein